MITIGWAIYLCGLFWAGAKTPRPGPDHIMGGMIVLGVLGMIVGTFR
jgi:hypothetical protein